MTPTELGRVVARAMNDLRRFKIETRILYIVAVALATLVALLLRDVESLRKDRVEDQAITNRAICERQEIALQEVIYAKEVLSQTNRGVIANARILSRLVSRVATPSAEPASPAEMERRARSRAALLEAKEQLDRNIERLGNARDALRAGIDDLQNELALVDCANLPANGPFEKPPIVPPAP